MDDSKTPEPAFVEGWYTLVRNGKAFYFYDHNADFAKYEHINAFSRRTYRYVAKAVIAASYVKKDDHAPDLGGSGDRRATPGSERDRVARRVDGGEHYSRADTDRKSASHVQFNSPR